MEEVFVYQASEQDAWMITVRKDFAEMLRVDPSRGVSRYERYEAPIEKIRIGIETLGKEGYTFCGAIDLKLRKLIEA